MLSPVTIIQRGRRVLHTRVLSRGLLLTSLLFGAIPAPKKRKDVIALSNLNNTLPSIRRIVLLSSMMIAVLVSGFVSFGQQAKAAPLKVTSKKLDPASP